MQQPNVTSVVKTATAVTSGCRIKQKKWEEDELVINYNDVCCIYGRDLDLLHNEKSWLNDTILHYQLIRLKERSCAAAACTTTGTSSSSNVLLFDPIVVSFFIHQLDLDDTEECVSFWRTYDRLQTTHRLLVPISDAMESGGLQSHRTGTHWTLLLIDIQKRVVANDTVHPLCDCATYTVNDNDFDSTYLWDVHGYHMDSQQRSGNDYRAQEVANKLQVFINRMQLHEHHCTITTTTTTKAQPETKTVTIQEVNVPQQQNGYDCGIHVLVSVETIMHDAYSFQHLESPNYFHITQKDRIMEQNFSMIERMNIARDIMTRIALFEATTG